MSGLAEVVEGYESAEYGVTNIVKNSNWLALIPVLSLIE